VASIVDVSPGWTAQLLDVVEAPPMAWIESRPLPWRERVAWGCADLSGPYRKANDDDALSNTAQVADPFHVVEVENGKLDECRRRV
jgi:transposase